MEKLGLQKEDCLVFEDTINGVRSAKAAGLICFAIQSNTDEHPNLTIADKLFLDFNEVKTHLVEQGAYSGINLIISLHKPWCHN